MKNVIMSTMLTTFFASTLCVDNVPVELAVQSQEETPTECNKTLSERVSGCVASVGRGLWKYRVELLVVAVGAMIAAQSYFAYMKFKDIETRLDDRATEIQKLMHKDMGFLGEHFKNFNLGLCSHFESMLKVLPEFTELERKKLQELDRLGEKLGKLDEIKALLEAALPNKSVPQF